MDPKPSKGKLYIDGKFAGMVENVEIHTCSFVEVAERATAAMQRLNEQLWRYALDENFGPTP